MIISGQWPEKMSRVITAGNEVFCSWLIVANEYRWVHKRRRSKTASLKRWWCLRSLQRQFVIELLVPGDRNSEHQFVQVLWNVNKVRVSPSVLARLMTQQEGDYAFVIYPFSAEFPSHSKSSSSYGLRKAHLSFEILIQIAPLKRSTRTQSCCLWRQPSSPLELHHFNHEEQKCGFATTPQPGPISHLGLTRIFFQAKSQETHLSAARRNIVAPWYLVLSSTLSHDGFMHDASITTRV